MDTRVPFVNLPGQDARIKGAVHDSVLRIIDQGNYILGKEVSEFEAAFAEYCGTDYAVAVGSGLAALELMLHASNIGAGDEVIVPAHTFVATAAAVTFAGARPVLVDVNEDDYTLDVSKLEAALTPRTRAILPVHLYGLPAQMDSIQAFAHQHALMVFEDAAQAHGARYDGRRVGTFGHASAFSFYPAKNLGACGDAGIVTTADFEVAERIRALRNCGQFTKYKHEMLPFNHRMDTIQAAVLLVRLQVLDEWNAARQQIAACYDSLLSDANVVRPLLKPDVREPVWHLYVIRVSDRDGLQQYLTSKSIGTGIHYPIPVHLQPVYQYLGYQRNDFPVSEAHADTVLSLPMHPCMSKDDVQYVVQAVREYVD